MKKKTRPEKGDIVCIVFKDHCENFNDAMQFEVYGKIIGITRWAITVASWQYHDEMQRAGDSSASSNEHTFSIVKKAIDSIRYLK